MGGMAAACRAPDEIAGGAFALVVDEPSFQHIGLFDIRVFVKGNDAARRHAEQNGHFARDRIAEQNLALGSRQGRLFPGQLGDIYIVGVLFENLFAHIGAHELPPHFSFVTNRRSRGS